MRGASRGLKASLLAAGLLLLLISAGASALAATSTPLEDDAIPIAGAFVYPVGDELDYTKPRAGEPVGYHMSDPYQSRRGSKEQRVHLGVDLSNGRGGSVVRSVASGVVMVVDPDARIRVRTKRIVKKTVLVKGKRVARRTARWHTSYHWRTGWGNYVLIHHLLPSGASVYSLYAHLAPSSVVVKRGQIVAAGDPIARIGSTGRTTSPHLHLEIRKSVPIDRQDGSELLAEQDAPTAEERSFALLETVDPLAFLQNHVRTFEDLEPGTWQARYALAACRDGVTNADGDRFRPEASVNRVDFYRALVSAFRLSSSFPIRDWSATVTALIDAGILDRGAASGEQPADRMTRSEALEILLRCLDRHRAWARNLAELDAMEVSRDFNREFAGASAAEEAEHQALAHAAAQTRARAKTESQRIARARQNARASGKKHPVKARRVRPVPPVPILDPGFQSAALSKQELTRAESCLLLATATRPGSERYSALQRAADRVAQSR